MAVYITGDLHRDFNRLKSFCYKNRTTLNDWIVCLGDVGVNFFGDKSDEIVKKKLTKLPINLFCIRGNHEIRPEHVKGYESVSVQAASGSATISGVARWDARYPNQFFACDGFSYQVMLEDGKIFNALVVGGAYSIDKYYRLENGWPWFEDEQLSVEEQTMILDLVTTTIQNPHERYDVVLSHSCPSRFVPTELFLKGVDQSRVDNKTEAFLDRLYELFPKDEKPHWYFGHFHGNKYEDGYTMLYNDIVRLV